MNRTLATCRAGNAPSSPWLQTCFAADYTDEWFIDLSKFCFAADCTSTTCAREVLQTVSAHTLSAATLGTRYTTTRSKCGSVDDDSIAASQRWHLRRYQPTKDGRHDGAMAHRNGNLSLRRVPSARRSWPLGERMGHNLRRASRLTECLRVLKPSC